MSLGTLAHHIASGPGMLSGWALQDKTEMSRDMGSAPEATSTAAVLAAHDEA